MPLIDVEALTVDMEPTPTPELTTSGETPWHVLWTRSNCEQLVYDQLTTKGFDVFLPQIEAWTRRGGLRRRARVPMFPGYVFLHHGMDKRAYLTVCQVMGVVRLLGERWDRLAVVPDPEIDALQRVAQARLPVFPHPYLREGQRVRITRGPFSDVEGLLVRHKPNKGLVVISVSMLRRSIAIEVDCTVVEAA